MLRAGNAVLDDRLRLVGYYLAHLIVDGRMDPDVHQRLVSQTRWFVEHEPDHPVLRNSLATSVNPNEDAFQDLLQLWRRQLDAYPRSPSVIGNAAQFYVPFDTSEALALYEKGRATDPGDDFWALRIADLRLLRSRTPGESAAKEAALALDAYRELLGHSGSTSQPRGRTLTAAARAALRAGDPAAAATFAQESLASEANPTDGDTVHAAHIVLGKIALDQGDAAKAGNELAAACNASRSLKLERPREHDAGGVL